MHLYIAYSELRITEISEQLSRVDQCALRKEHVTPVTYGEAMFQIW